jgi:hypothetical protein
MRQDRKNHNFLFLFLICQEKGQRESLKLKGNNNGLRPQYIKKIFAEYCQPQTYLIFLFGSLILVKLYTSITDFFPENVSFTIIV